MPSAGSVRRLNANQAMSAAIAMNPREAAKAKGYIDSVISLTKTKLLPQVPEMTIRFVHSVDVDTFLIWLPASAVMMRGAFKDAPTRMLRLTVARPGAEPIAKALHHRQAKVGACPKVYRSVLAGAR